MELRNGDSLSLPVPVLSLLLRLIFWTAGAFPCDSCMENKAWCVRLLRGMVNGLGVGFPAPKGLETTTPYEISDVLTGDFSDEEVPANNLLGFSLDS
ncbi:hypothetical protein TNCV_4535281 [Trichonephila clavipes]|nr:hypothetical protein TNCV_4535281 [Trichonephila clavipes]